MRIGEVNKNGQKLVAITDQIGNHPNSRLQRLECPGCGHSYLANACDAPLRKCPKCQGGRPESVN